MQMGELALAPGGQSLTVTKKKNRKNHIAGYVHILNGKKLRRRTKRITVKYGSYWKKWGNKIQHNTMMGSKRDVNMARKYNLGSTFYFYFFSPSMK
jgi:hypothetical protein